MTWQPASSHLRRAPSASKKRRGFACCLGPFLLFGCATVGPAPAPEVEDAIVLRPGSPTEAEEERAAATHAEALEYLQSENWAMAAARARAVVTDLPSTRVSGSAAWVLARAARRVGDLDGALDATRLYAGALGEGDERLPEVRLLEAEILHESGQSEQALSVVLRLPLVGADELRGRALSLVRDIAISLPPEQLSVTAQDAAQAGVLGTPLLAAHARILHLRGESAEAARFARATLDAGPASPERDRALTVLGQGGQEGMSPLRLGVLLPTGGSPSLQRMASQLEQGIRAAVEEAEGVPVELVMADDQGDPIQSAQAIRELEGQGVVGVIGPVFDDALESVLEARGAELPIISPTALSPPSNASAYSLGSADPGGAQALAQYAFSSGLRRVVVIHGQGPKAVLEATAFQEAYQASGGVVLAMLQYLEGATYFADQLRGAEALDPEALVIPAPTEDIVALAPQISFFGLDTLGIKVLGTDEWTEDEILLEVAPRHTNGVVVASPRGAEGVTEAYQQFVEAYERQFRQSLRDPTPALGYDAARLFLTALRAGVRTPAEMRRALPLIQGFPGATGVISLEGGQIRREHHVVCIQERGLLTAVMDRTTLHFRPMRPGDPEEGEPEEVPAGPIEIYCAGAEPPELRQIG